MFLRTTTTVLTAAAALLSAGGPTASAAHAPGGGWQQVGDDIKSGISGLAVTSDGHRQGRTDALVVRDNKKPGENRVARLTYRPGADRTAPTHVEPLAWTGTAEPVDLEAIEAVPGARGEFVALASRGLVHHLKMTGTGIQVLDTSPLPATADGDDYESFALTSRHGKLAAVWADRGAGEKRPATLRASTFSFNKSGEADFGPVSTARLRAPYPTGDVRHASDISVAPSGRLVISSASDAGDDGPFASAVLNAGTLSVSRSGKVRLSVAKSPEVLRKFKGVKIEAVECLPGTGGRALLGTDDENAGGSVNSASVCGR
ncbi:MULTISPECIES: hypothetical protein [Streptomyces]|uniref:Secreted protein n=1 Tax=Streptomyces venezuelae TaxID=54571 RepID=A0A5P2BIM4_STRVZ|nr:MULTISPECIES: hypothetical protein [Streptomyces]NEA03223.1 hypothetical protein [Streptomyces sp. SID10116]MYY85447.1 hypothetical protein [Streptomyces sp. SID335]MYZ12892.1 hypothetical protein [Streptomyces sp. SID337]NDZ87327.1 hypothetical protein [Streptomyces sp. SID10115]NEB48498.1 hypothetical protein [Streptomyces sp. SID339]